MTATGSKGARQERSPVSVENVARLFNPRSIALVGATDRSGWSKDTFNNLAPDRFDGEVHLVNPRGGLVHGKPALTSVAELPDGVDRSAMILGLTAQIGAAADFSLRAEGKAAQPNTGAVHFLIAGGESVGRMVAQKAAAEAWGVTPEIVPDVPHHALAHKPEVLVPILLKRLR